MIPEFPFNHQIQLAVSDQMMQSFIDSTAKSGKMLNLTQVFNELTGDILQSTWFCFLPDLCDTYPDTFDLGFAISFDAETKLKFLDGNIWSFTSPSLRITTNKEEELLHDFAMENVNATMNLFINHDGSLDGWVQTLHFTGGEIVTPAQLLVNPKNIGWIAGSF